MNNLFVNIRKYIPRKNTNPKENFFTEVLAFILRTDEKLLSKFIEVLGLQQQLFEKSPKVITQSRHKLEKNNKYIDLEIIIHPENCQPISIFIENKFGSSVSETIEEKDDENWVNNQLDNYLEIQKARNTVCKGYVVLLTQYNEIIDESKTEKLLKHIYWSDIYELFNNINKHKSLDEVSNFLINQFVELMRSENMEPYEKIDKKQLEHFGRHLNNVLKLVDNVGKNFSRKRFRYKFCDPKLKKEDDCLSFPIKKINERKEEKVSLDYNYKENSFVFYVNLEKQTLIDRKQYSKLQDNEYSTSEDRDDFYPGKKFDAFFDLKTAHEQVNGLANFCNEQIKLCEKLKIIHS